MIFFKDFVSCPSNDAFDKNKKISMLVLGLHGKGGMSTKDKDYISNPKVNYQPHLSILCANFTRTPKTIYSIEGLPYWGFQRYDYRRKFNQWLMLPVDFFSVWPVVLCVTPNELVVQLPIA